jgi:hypothetical protein
MLSGQLTCLKHSESDVCQDWILSLASVAGSIFRWINRLSPKRSRAAGMPLPDKQSGQLESVDL